MNNKKIMVVAGGEWQAPIIEKIKQKGYEVVITNLYADTPGSILADRFHKVDVCDVEENIEIARQEAPDAVLTDQSDIAVRTVAAIADSLNLPGIGIAAAELFTNKHLMRKFCKENDFPYPDYRLVHDVGGINNAISHIGYPLVLKPICNQSSRGVIRVNSEDEILEAINECVKHANDDDGFLVEQYLEGTEYTVEGFKDSAGHNSLAISEKSHFESNSMIASTLLYKPKFDRINVSDLMKSNDMLVEKMDLSFGITHAEYIYSNGVFYLVEIAARGGGTKISSHIVPFVSGVDVNELLIECCLGSDSRVQRAGHSVKCCMLKFFDFAIGKVIDHTDEMVLTNMPGIIDFKYNFNKGDKLLPIGDDRSRHAHAIIGGDTESEVMENYDSLMRCMVLDYD